MVKSNPVLVMEEIDGKMCLRIEQINNNSIPAELNGESGFHVYHVRMLTELILKQLMKNGNHFGLTEENISFMSVASSLHDIGKLRIPKSILDFPGRLSPVEYDIVKKHSVLGEEIIEEAEVSGVDEKVLLYAKEIARGHHERYDGMGYPDALKGDDIPISAQVVSLADAFDALTSVRNYKKAVSQDVAIEMIANGMSGVFNPLLIDSLLQVINNEVLVDIRNQLEKNRSTVSGMNFFSPKNVLLIGNTGYITQEFIDETFYDSKIMLVGETSLKSNSKLKVFNYKNTNIKSVFDTYEFDVIIYFARELTLNSSEKSDVEELRVILESYKNTQKDSKFLYLSSLDAAFEEMTDRGLIAGSKENLCEYYRNSYSLEIRVVRIPYLYSGAYKKGYLFKLFERMYSGETVQFDEVKGAKAYFLSMIDLSEFINRFFDNFKSGTGILNINDEFNVSFGDIADKLCGIRSDAKIDFTGNNSAKHLKVNNKAVRSEYGWFSKIPILDEIEEEYQKFLVLKSEIFVSFLDKIKHWMKNHTQITKMLEILVLFLITEVLILLTDSATFFSIVDFRMAYIVIVATIHGLNYGLVASGLTSVSWFLAKVASGTKAITIFYEPTNWLAFVFFFLVGSLCGYIKLKNDDKIKDLTEQNELVEEKLVFTRELYNDTFDEKRALKKQIIGSKDSFGKIFDVTRQLDTVEPRQLYLRIMDTFEDILENKSVSVYSVNENAAFARLEVSSRDIIGSVSRSISLESYATVIEKLNSDQVFKNTELSHGLPMYASGIKRKGKLELIIFVWHAGQDQRSLYYVNLFKILCDLVQMSLLRAYDYNQAIYEKQYITGTNILNVSAFESLYENFKQMAERKVFSYIQLEADCRGFSPLKIQEMFAKRIRTNDIMGIADDGKVRILLSQATKKDLEFIMPRFESLDVEIKVLEK